jgi:hypothetical protein
MRKDSSTPVPDWPERRIADDINIHVKIILFDVIDLTCLIQELKTPMPPDQMVPIWEECKDMGLLLGKGGLQGNVSLEIIV